MAGVTVAYSGVHTAYQIALAAEEAGFLDRFLCSLFLAPGKWGGLIANVIGNDKLVSRGCPELPASKVLENLWPLLQHLLRSRLDPRKSNDWFTANDRFDLWASKQLCRLSSRVFIGYETCAERCLHIAKSAGMTAVLDSPQVHPAFLRKVYEEAEQALGFKLPKPIDRPEMTYRKDAEFALADYILVYSDVHRRSFQRAGVAATKLVAIPLWADEKLWAMPHNYNSSRGRPLSVLFVGSISVRKGIPWLLQAAKALNGNVCLTMLGSIQEDIVDCLPSYRALFHHVPAQSRLGLRKFYQEADVFVLPSLVDAFGYVAMEAMLAGLPVIVSENCGVPVPDPSWRVRVMDCDAIVSRLALYAENRTLLEEHGSVAKQFARRFTPVAYRQKVQEFLRRLL